MLCLTVPAGQWIDVGQEGPSRVAIKAYTTPDGRVKIMFDAPREIPIQRRKGREETPR